MKQQLVALAAITMSINISFANENQSIKDSDVTSAPLLTAVNKTGRYIISFKSTPLSDIHKNKHNIQRLSKHGVSPVRLLPSINAVVAALTPSQYQRIQQDDTIAYIEPDPVRYLQNDQTPWGIARVQAPQLSDAAAGNQKVCIIDSGYNLGHEDLMTGANVTGEVVDSIGGQAELGNWFEDDYGHGTHIAGIISSVDNHIGLLGVNPGNQLNLHNVKIIHDPNYWKIWGSDMIAAVEACTNAGATVINMSIGGMDSSEAERQAMQTAYDNGTLLFAAAGNRGSVDYFYPASYDSVVSVGAIDETGTAWRYTQSNDQTELVAPGVEIKSTIPGNQYGKKNGTSMATAFASGAAALVWSHYPQCSASQIRKVLTKSANDLGDAGQDPTYGYGEIQARNALELLDAQGCGAGDDFQRSCKAILDAGLSTGNGIYTIDFDGNDGPLAPMDVECDMTRDGGGWTGLTPEIGYDLNGGVLVSMKSTPTRGFSNKRPYTQVQDVHYLEHYNIPVHSNFTEFYLQNHVIRATGNNEFDIASSNAMSCWTCSINNYWGDLGIGGINDNGPVFRLSAYGTIQINAGTNYQLPQNNTFSVSPTNTLRIGWSQFGPYEGLYPWWAGKIFIR